MAFEHAKITLGARNDDHIDVFGANEAFWRDEFEVEGHLGLRRFRCQLGSLFNRFFDAANHVEGRFREMVILTINHSLE